MKIHHNTSKLFHLVFDWIQRRLSRGARIDVTDLDTTIKTLVCEKCWSTVFFLSSFQSAWNAASNSAGSNTGFTYTTPSWSEIQDSVEHMCEWCILVSEEIIFFYGKLTRSPNPPPPTITFTISVHFSYQDIARPLPNSVLMLELVIENDWRPHFLVHAASDNLAANYISERSPVSDMDSRTAYNYIQQCIQDCSHHEICPQPSPNTTLPTRVIDCSDLLRPRVFITNGSVQERYITLSYVWGEEQPYRLTTHNIGSYDKFVNPEYIPDTIRDAITVAHKLSLRYLWVDSLCIIQDSEEDKAHEISKIHSIFRNAFLTIVAARAENASAGFLHNKISLNTPSSLPFIAPDGSTGVMLLSEQERSPPESTDQRAWCLEERVLSPRALVYSKNALQYECQAGRVNVNNSHNFLPTPQEQPRLPDFVFTLGLDGNTPNEPSERDKAKSWSHLLQQYTQRALTKPRDRLVALGALSKQFHSLWPSSKYIAGLWTHQLPHALLWRTRTKGKILPRPQKYRAPSWSWASVDTGIRWSDSNLHDMKSHICDIIDTHVVLKNSADPYGEVISGSLTINSILTPPVIWNLADDSLYESEEMTVVIGSGTADATGQNSGDTWEVVLAIIRDTGDTQFGLCLTPKPGDFCEEGHSHTNIYQRVGSFHAQFNDRDKWLSIPHQQFKLV
ncbi:heterokaryon incompatibility protein-domain-containing protein [Collybia nuda]|uniref:Heterokaryon incompatibility protein-domain-containing protein n=1 Tax=Collybia nuda TaxID=64659 RepID=A0A9P6CF05_9AGAR|nr:heterokaryon incompatibility protein-domain-containing protein [Collybia nuda]